MNSSNTLRCLALLAVSVAAFPACGDQSAPNPPMKEKPMTGLGMPKPKRVGPTDVDPATVDGVRFEAIHWGRQRGLGQNGGYVAAIDPASGKELWVAQIYVVDYIPKLETDVQDIFIKKLEPGASKGELKVVDERGRLFVLDIAKRTATPAK